MVFVGVGEIATELRHTVEFTGDRGCPFGPPPALEKPNGEWIQTARTKRVPIVVPPVPRWELSKRQVRSCEWAHKKRPHHCENAPGPFALMAATGEKYRSRLT